MTHVLDDKAILPPDLIEAGIKQLSEGRKVVYPVSDLPSGEFVRQYPDGQKFVVKLIDGKLEERREYNTRVNTITNEQFHG